MLKSHGSLDLYLNKMLETKASHHHVDLAVSKHLAALQDRCIDFWKWLEVNFPPQDHVPMPQESKTNI